MPNTDPLEKNDQQKSIIKYVASILRSPLRKLKLKNFEKDDSLRDTIEELIEDSNGEDTSIELDERALLGNVLSLRDLTAQDVMTPRADVVAIPITADANEVAAIITRTKRCRYPVYRDTVDDVVGILDIKNYLAWTQTKKNFNLRQLLTEALFISPAMRTLDLLFLMRETGTKIALVVDEYGGVDGLVAFSDLIEEIIGDIQDAQNQNIPSTLEKRSDGTIIADGRITLETLADEQHVDLRNHNLADDIETIGGLVISVAGRVPTRGELIKYQPANMEFEILDADPRRIKRISLKQTG